MGAEGEEEVGEGSLMVGVRIRGGSSVPPKMPPREEARPGGPGWE